MAEMAGKNLPGKNEHGRKKTKPKASVNEGELSIRTDRVDCSFETLWLSQWLAGSSC